MDQSQTPFPPATPPSQTKTAGLAIWSLVLGILSFLCFSLIAGIPAIICGHMGLTRIKQSNGMLTGKGMATAGLVLGYLSIIFSLLLIPVMLGMLLPALAKAKEKAVTITCINNLRTIDMAKRQWALDEKKADSDTPTAQDLEKYLPTHSLPICPAGGSYSINVLIEEPTCTVPKHVMSSM